MARPIKSKLATRAAMIAFIIPITLVALSTGEARPVKTPAIKGKIESYECGDNCYLTIVDMNQRKHIGLCVAQECKAWNYAAEMPPFFVGKRVVVVVGVGLQLNGNGDVMNKRDSFTSIEFLP